MAAEPGAQRVQDVADGVQKHRAGWQQALWEGVLTSCELVSHFTGLCSRLCSHFFISQISASESLHKCLTSQSGTNAKLLFFII